MNDLRYHHDVSYPAPPIHSMILPLLPETGRRLQLRISTVQEHGALLTRCSHTGLQCKQWVRRLSNESPGELTLLARCLNTFQMLQHVSLGFLCLLSHTITLSAVAPNS